MKEICPNCHLGALLPRPTTYAAWHRVPIGKGSARSMFILVPGVMAWTCAVCGARFLDRKVIDRLKLLAGPAAKLGGGASLSGGGRRPRPGSKEGDPQLRQE